ncbi:hypothetical protein GEMRC1_002766 [Eukaryota sp. GEM-RC1]
MSLKPHLVTHSAPRHVRLSRPSPPQSAFQIPSSQLCRSLRGHRKQQHLTDSTIVFGEETYTCHSTVISLFNDVLASKVMNSSSHQAFALLEQLLPDPSLFITVLNSFYGGSVPCTEDNFHLLRTIALSLKYQKLEEFIQKVLKSGFKSCQFQLESNVITSELVKSAVRDVSLSYKKTTVRINSLLLSCFSDYFRNLFNSQFLDSATRNFKYSNEFPGVEGDVFVEFFKAALCESISISPVYVLSFYQLSVYFQVEGLQKVCLDFINKSSFSKPQLYRLLSTANERGLFHFIQSNVNIWKSSTISHVKPIPLDTQLFESLTRVLGHQWLTRCLVLTATTTEVNSTEVSEILSILNVNSLSILFEILQPLFKNQSFELVMMNYSFQLFQSCSSIESIPREWFLWTFKAFDKNQRLNELTFLVKMFTKVFPEIEVCPNDFSQLSPKTFELLATELNQTYSLWLLEQLVNSYQSNQFNHWTVDEFKACIKSFDLSLSDPVKFIDILQKLKNDQALSKFLNDFYVQNLPIISNFQQVKISSLEQELDSQKKLTTRLEESVKLLETQVGDISLKFQESQQQINNSFPGQSVVVPRTVLPHYPCQQESQKQRPRLVSHRPKSPSSIITSGSSEWEEVEDESSDDEM